MEIKSLGITKQIAATTKKLKEFQQPFVAAVIHQNVSPHKIESVPVHLESCRPEEDQSGPPLQKASREHQPCLGYLLEECLSLKQRAEHAKSQFL